MVDLSKQLAMAKQSIDKRQYDVAIEQLQEYQEVDPANLELYRLLVDAAKRRAKEKGGKGGLFGGIGTLSIPTKDTHKALGAAMKRVAKTPDAKSLAAAGEAAQKVAATGAKGLNDVAIFLYEEVRSTGLFNADALFNLGNLYFERFKATQSDEALQAALRTMAELERAMPQHPTAAKLMREWEAAKSIKGRDKAQASAGTADYRGQVANADAARRAEVMNRMIRTVEDAREVLGYLDKDLAANPGDKGMWVKKGDTHRRIGEFAPAREAYAKAQQIDQHDFVVTMKLGDTRMEELKARIAAAEQGGQDVAALRQELLQVEVEEYRKRIERQPTEMQHRFELAKRLFALGQIEPAATEFQQTVRDPRLKRHSHQYLGHCFSKKGLLDLAVQQFDGALKLMVDDLVDEAKQVRYNRARLYEQMGKKTEAMADYTRLVEIDLGYKDAADRLAKLRG